MKTCHSKYCFALSTRSEVRTKLVTSLGHQGWRRVFWEGLKLLKLCLIVFNYAQHIFPEEAKNFSGETSPHSGYGPGQNQVSISVYLGPTINKHEIMSQKQTTLEQHLFCSQDIW